MKWLELPDGFYNVQHISYIEKGDALVWGGPVVNGNYTLKQHWFKIHFTDNKFIFYKFNTEEMRNDAYSLICDKISEGNKIIFNI